MVIGWNPNTGTYDNEPNWNSGRGGVSPDDQAVWYDCYNGGQFDNDGSTCAQRTAARLGAAAAAEYAASPAGIAAAAAAVLAAKAAADQKVIDDKIAADLAEIARVDQIAVDTTVAMAAAGAAPAIKSNVPFGDAFSAETWVNYRWILQDWRTVLTVIGILIAIPGLYMMINKRGGRKRGTSTK